MYTQSNVHITIHKASPKAYILYHSSDSNILKSQNLRGGYHISHCQGLHWGMGWAWVQKGDVRNPGELELGSVLTGEGNME